jgi:aminoglycoside phosphotransferase (APT) family kinase protein
MTTWQAEVAIDEPLVRELLGQFAAVEAGSLRLLSEGWDRSAWLVDEALVFGFPRRAAAVPGLRREIAVLPRLAPLLPLPIQVPVHVGHPTEAYPWPFSGSALLPGLESGDADLDPAARRRVGVELARFLRRLHGAEVADALGPDALPPDANRRADMALRVPRTRDLLLELERLGSWRRPASLDSLLDDAERLPPPTAGAVVHGDLHFRHVLVDEGRASGVIDWIDLCRGDPAIDLQLLWSFLPPADRPAFLDAYGPVGEVRLLRARIVALSLSAQLALYGRVEGHERLEREALASLGRALDGAAAQRRRR